MQEAALSFGNQKLMCDLNYSTATMDDRKCDKECLGLVWSGMNLVLTHIENILKVIFKPLCLTFLNITAISLFSYPTLSVRNKGVFLH